MLLFDCWTIENLINFYVTLRCKKVTFKFKVFLVDGFFFFGYIFSFLVCRLLAEVACIQKGIESVDKIDLKMFSVWHLIKRYVQILKILRESIVHR